MGKAAQRRKARRVAYLVDLSNKGGSRFKEGWEIRLQSWLQEIQLRGEQWRNGGEGSQKRIFAILDEAMDVLHLCEGITPEFMLEAHGVLSHECCMQVARTVDSRLCRLSNMERLPYKAAHSARV